MTFQDRRAAGRSLAAALDHYAAADCVVLALPRGGVPVAAEVAAHLSAPLDLLIVRKIGVPEQPELAMGAVIDGPDPLVIRNPEVIRAAGITETAFGRAEAQALSEIARRRARYLSGRPPVPVEGRTAIVVDDGIATGATMRAGLGGLRRRKPDRIVLAVPVAPADTLDALRDAADAVVCLEQPADFGAIGRFYRDFRQVTDEEVLRHLAEAPPDPGDREDAGPAAPR